MPLTRSPTTSTESRRLQGLSPIMPLTRSPTTSTAAASINNMQETLDVFTYPENTSHTQQNPEQVTNNINKRFEEMQTLLNSQMSAIQSLIECNNLNFQTSIASLREDIRNVESSVSRIDVPNIQNISSYSTANPSSETITPTAPISIIYSNPPITSTSVVTPQLSCLVSEYNMSVTPNVLGATCAPTSAVSQPITCTSSAPSFPMPTTSSQSIQGHRQKKIYPLPKFSGLPEEWQTFYESFKASTQEFEYTDLYNIMRLRDCLEGNARESVESLLTSSKNVDAIIETLSQMFGRPEQLIKSQIHKVRSLPSVNESDLNSLINFANKIGNMATFLVSVGGSYHLANPLLLSELLSKLPMSRRLQWADKCLKLERMPTIVDFSLWLSDVRKVVNMATDAVPTPNETEGNKKYAFLTVNNKICRLCDDTCKSLSVCNIFTTLPLEMRWQKAKLFKVCFSCLKFGHQSNNCYSKQKCEIDGCDRYHHNLLHNDKLLQNSNTTRNSLNASQARNCLVDVNYHSTLFQIIPVKLYGPNGSEDIYAFIDDGANVSMLDHEIVKKLGLSGRKDILEIQWINRQVSREQTEIVDLVISGLDTNQCYNMKNIYVTSNLDLPNQSFNASHFQNTLYDHGIPLNSYNEIKPKMIISLAHAYLTVPIETPRLLTPTGPIATKTKLGWVIYGNVKDVTKGRSVSCHFRKSENSQESDNRLEDLMKNYFGIETFGVRHCEPLKSEDDQRALDILDRTTKRIGRRFESGLLWRKDFNFFPESYNMALKRLYVVEKKMASDSKYAKEYCDKIQEYVEKDYARILSADEASKHSNKTFYLPHFGVKNPNKKKMRFVFDAAAEVENMSLNKALLPGPNLNQPLMKVLFKFRQGPIAVCGDLKEMFHQVSIISEDQDSLRFLWRNGDISQPPQTYVMRRMIFGAACSPTTAQYVKNRNAEEFMNDYPRAAAGIIEKHYVDDYVDCFDSEEEAIEVVKAVKFIHEAGGFEMHNLLTNSKVVAKKLGISNDEELNIVADDIERILGMHWMSKSDLFVFTLKFQKVPKEVMERKRIPTKRQLLCIAMSVYDPFGFLADFMVIVKILMQEVWKTGVDWESKLPAEIYERFNLWMTELPKIAEYKISRFYFVGCDMLNVELHLFCDASEEALAAVGYWRIENRSNTKVVFVTGKTSCAPMRFHSIPKLELQAAVMAARLKTTIVNCHDMINIRRVVFWSDSITVIRWIRSDHRKYKQYVANRVSEILENSELINWRWCPTQQNPADVATRAKFPINYDPEGRWKNGPDFLQLEEKDWPDEGAVVHRVDKCDEFAKSKHFVMAAHSLNLFEAIVKGSSRYKKVVRVVAWIKRFIKNCQRMLRRGPKTGGELKEDEISEAEIKIVQDIQRSSFAHEYKRLKANMNIDLSSDLKTLNPYIDEQGLIRVGGRLENAQVLSEYAKRPVILPKNHRFSRVLVEYYHTKNCHQNTANVIGDVREKYWIPSLRSLVRSVESQCVACKIRKAKPVQPQMGILPIDRVTPYVRPFTFTGVDLFGPFMINIRRRHEKRWVVLFTCLTVRAIHLEVVPDLSTDSFILSLRNFVNRRGVPSQIRSDNGRNFVGIDKELRNEFNFMDFNDIVRNSSPLGIKWIFNTPSDPSSGGVWERLVQSVKKSLYVLLGNITPKLDVFSSFLIECENIVNSRPLTHIPVTPYEPEPITPNHFLLGCVNSTQIPSTFDPKLNCLRKQWRILQNLKNGFWTRWIREYLPDLTRRVKWCLPNAALHVGSLVLICDENAARSKWRRGRVVGVYVGKDGIPRAADVKTCDGLLKRPISKLAVLDVSNL